MDAVSVQQGEGTVAICRKGWAVLEPGWSPKEPPISTKRKC